MLIRRSLIGLVGAMGADGGVVGLTLDVTGRARRS